MRYFHTLTYRYLHPFTQFTDTQYIDTQLNGTQYTDTQLNGTQHS